MVEARSRTKDTLYCTSPTDSTRIQLIETMSSEHQSGRALPYLTDQFLISEKNETQIGNLDDGVVNELHFAAAQNRFTVDVQRSLSVVGHIEFACSSQFDGRLTPRHFERRTCNSRCIFKFSE